MIHAPALSPAASRVREVEAGGELLPLEGLDPVGATLFGLLAAVLRAQDRSRLSGEDALLVVGAGARGLPHAPPRSPGVETVRSASKTSLAASSPSWGRAPAAARSTPRW